MINRFNGERILIKRILLFSGSMISLGILSHALKWNDALIGVLGSFFDLLAAIAFFLASEPWQIYCGNY